MATDETDPRDGGFCFTVPGELLGPPMTCDKPSCGCGWSFAGLASVRGTTLALVADRDDLDEVEGIEGLPWSAEVAAGHEVGTLLVYSHPRIMPLSEWIDRHGLDARADGETP